MSGLTHLRLAALCAFTYALLAVSGLVHHFQRTGSLRALVRGLMHPQLWVVLLLALFITIGLFGRRAWAWWLAVAAGLFGLYWIVGPWVHRGLARAPGTPTLIALALLLAMLLLLVPRSARLAANR
jgi:hypothetical protein